MQVSVRVFQETNRKKASLNSSRGFQLFTVCMNSSIFIITIMPDNNLEALKS